MHKPSGCVNFIYKGYNKTIRKQKAKKKGPLNGVWNKLVSMQIKLVHIRPAGDTQWKAHLLRTCGSPAPISILLLFVLVLGEACVLYMEIVHEKKKSV